MHTYIIHCMLLYILYYTHRQRKPRPSGWSDARSTVAADAGPSGAGRAVSNFMESELMRVGGQATWHSPDVANKYHAEIYH